MRRALIISACLIMSLFPAACSGIPGTEMEIECIHYGIDVLEDEYEPLPEYIQDVPVTHAVRAQIYACVDYEWQPIGGVMNVYVDGQAAQPNVVSGVSISGVNNPWPYEGVAVHGPFQLPLYIQPGIAVTVTASVSSLLDAGEMIACWFVSAYGGELSGTRSEAIQRINGGGLATANCIAGLTG